MQRSFYGAALLSSEENKLHSGTPLLKCPADFSAGEAGSSAGWSCSSAGWSHSPAARS